MTIYLPLTRGTDLPDWVPESARHYLVHTENGLSIRALARRGGYHASTVLRQIRKIEMRRDDPLVDAALKSLGEIYFPLPLSVQTNTAIKEYATMNVQSCPENMTPNSETLNREARRILRRLCETGAVLAVAADMENAVVVRDGVDGSSTRTAVVNSAIAQAMALKDWIACKSVGRITRYHITQAGRSALGRLLAEHESKTRLKHDTGFSEAQNSFMAQNRNWGEKVVPDTETGEPRRMRYNLAESPLAALARRRTKQGLPFLSEDLVTVGERLREDFELAQMGPRVTQNWDSFLTGGVQVGTSGDSGIGTGPEAARDRVSKALAELGPGLSDVALRCCCFLEGLELAEKRMGWSARSAKIVLRIALQRLKRHYDETQGRFGPMIG